MGQSIKTWIGATVVLAVLIAIAGWFLLISPTKAATADTRSNIDTETNRTVTLTKALASLKAQFEGLDASRTALADVMVQVPTSADTSAFRRVLEERASTTGVTLMSLQTGTAAAVVQAAQGTAGAAGSGASATSTATPSPSPAPSAAPTAPSTVTTASGQTLVGVPLQMTVVGTYDAARGFVASLQGTEGRLFLVTGFTVVSQADASANAGRPATVKGDVEVTLQGFLVVLTAGPDDVVTSPGATPSPTPSAGPTPSPSPLPSTERNPFAPIASPAP